MPVTPNSLEKQACLARLSLKTGDAESARKLCETMIAADRRFARAYLIRASLRSSKEALADLDEAIFLEPGMAEAYRRRAILHESLDQSRTSVDRLFSGH